MPRRCVVVIMSVKEREREVSAVKKRVLRCCCAAAFLLLCVGTALFLQRFAKYESTTAYLE